MAHGYPDYQVPTRIEAQDIADLDVDIIAQTLGNLAVDIAAQTLADLDINIDSQTLTTVATDIAAQSVGNITTDIAAQSLGNLAVDIAAQTVGNIAMDLTAQTISNLDVDIDAQTIGEVIQRPKFGGFTGFFPGWSLLANETKTLATVSGTGTLHGMGVVVNGATSSHELEIADLIDGTGLMGWYGFDDLNSWGMTPDTTPVRLIEYNAGGRCVMSYLFPGTCTFESSVALKVRDTSGNAQSGRYWIVTSVL